jgi:hypothetical protein
VNELKGKNIMAMEKADVSKWLETIPEDCTIAISNDGIGITALYDDGTYYGAYLEIGGVPEEADNDI